jgi:hypothetical protein
MNFKYKYIKYKNKYMNLKGSNLNNQIGGAIFNKNNNFNFQIFNLNDNSRHLPEAKYKIFYSSDKEKKYINIDRITNEKKNKYIYNFIKSINYNGNLFIVGYSISKEGKINILLVFKINDSYDIFDVISDSKNFKDKSYLNISSINNQDINILYTMTIDEEYYTLSLKKSKFFKIKKIIKDFEKYGIKIYLVEDEYELNNKKIKIFLDRI